MSIAERIVSAVTSLPAEKQERVLHFAESLRNNAPPPASAERYPFGVLRGESFKLTENDVREARREMWGGFPREIRG